VQSGHWPLFRYNPALKSSGKNPFQLDSKAPSVPLEQYLYNETRYSQLRQTHPEDANRLLREARADVQARWMVYQKMAGVISDVI